MNVADERTRSLWKDVELTPAPTLDRHQDADAVVIGAGIAGLSVAYELAARGLSIVVLDRGRVGSGMTARTTAHLATAIDDGYAEIAKTHGSDAARLVHQSQAAAIDRMEAIQAAEAIDCDFERVDGYLLLAPGTPGSALDEELAACSAAGVPVSDLREQTPLHAKNLVRSLHFHGQARIHPLKYIGGLAKAIAGRKGRFFGETRVDSIEEEKNGVVVKTAGGHEVRARHAVVATNSPINNRLALHAKQAPYRTYAIAASLPRGVLPDGLYWDTADPYHYVRLQPAKGHDVVIVGGEDHKSGEADDGERRLAALERWIRERLPKMGNVTHRWSGQVLEPVDALGFYGRNPGSHRIFIATGDSGQGITGGALAGLIISDLIAGARNPWAELYDPARRTAKSLGEFVRENMTVVKNFAEYLTAGDLKSIEGLRAGQGAIFRSGFRKIAACRDTKGRLHVHSASCTHAGCILHWNSLEQCWDCPCHGSQFSPDGTALNGPAVDPLAPAEEKLTGAAAE